MGYDARMPQICTGCRQPIGRHTTKQIAQCNRATRDAARDAALILVGQVQPRDSLDWYQT